jgi:hypothetical protein
MNDMAVWTGPPRERGTDVGPLGGSAEWTEGDNRFVMPQF